MVCLIMLKISVSSLSGPDEEAFIAGVASADKLRLVAVAMVTEASAVPVEPDARFGPEEPLVGAAAAMPADGGRGGSSSVVALPFAAVPAFAVPEGLRLSLVFGASGVASTTGGAASCSEGM